MSWSNESKIKKKLYLMLHKVTVHRIVVVFMPFWSQLVCFTVFYFRSNVNEASLVRNVRIIAETLARHVYNLTTQGNIQLFTDSLVCIVTLN